MDPETGALSVEDAVAHLSIEEAVEDQPQAPETSEIEDTAPETVSEEDDQPDETEDESETPAEEDPELPAIDPPKSWDADHKEKFASLPREVQEYLVERETERDRGVSVAQQKAAEARQRAETEAQAISAFKPHLEGLISQAQQQFQSRWAGMDATAWQQLAQTDPNRYVQAKAAYDADVQAQQQLDAARQQAEAVEWSAFAQAQTARLPEIASHIASDPAVQNEVFEYIAKSTATFSAEQRKWVSADEMLIAWKAMQYDKAQAPQPKPQGKKAAPVVKPSAPPIPQKQRHVAQVQDRFRKTGSIDDAVALLNQKG